MHKFLLEAVQQYNTILHGHNCDMETEGFSGTSRDWCNSRCIIIQIYNGTTFNDIFTFDVSLLITHKNETIIIDYNTRRNCFKYFLHWIWSLHVDLTKHAFYILQEFLLSYSAFIPVIEALYWKISINLNENKGGRLSVKLRCINNFIG